MEAKLYDVLKEYSGKLFDGIFRLGNVFEKRRKLVFSFVLLALFGLIFILNWKTPVVLDDFVYSLGKDGARISSFREILEFQYAQYHNWGGRVVAHIVAQSLLAVNPLLADVLNSLLYVVFTLLLYAHVIGRSKRHSLFVLILIISLNFVLQPAFGESFLWLTGSANYLWTTVLLLLFLLPYRLYDGEGSSNALLKSIGMLVLGLLAGWTNENTAAAVIAMAVLFILSFRLRNIKMPLWAVIGVVGMLIGYVFMIVAPGNAERTRILGLDGTVDLIHIVKTFVFATLELIQSYGILNLILLIALVLVLKNTKLKEQKQRLVFSSAIYIVGMLVCLYVMCFSPFFPTRSWFGVICFNIIALGIVVHHVNFTLSSEMKKIRSLSVVFLVSLFFAWYYVAYTDVSAMAKMWDERIVAMREQKDETLIFKIYKPKTRYTVEDTVFLSEPVSRFYGARVTFEE